MLEPRDAVGIDTDVARHTRHTPHTTYGNPIRYRIIGKFQVLYSCIT